MSGCGDEESRVCGDVGRDVAMEEGGRRREGRGVMGEGEGQPAEKEVAVEAGAGPAGAEAARTFSPVESSRRILSPPTTPGGTVTAIFFDGDGGTGDFDGDFLGATLVMTLCWRASAPRLSAAFSGRSKEKVSPSLRPAGTGMTTFSPVESSMRILSPPSTPGGTATLICLGGIAAVCASMPMSIVAMRDGKTAAPASHHWW